MSQDECGCSLKHKTGFIHKELERISLGPADKRRKTANAQASSATEAMLMSEVRHSVDVALIVCEDRLPA